MRLVLCLSVITCVGLEKGSPAPPRWRAAWEGTRSQACGDMSFLKTGWPEGLAKTAHPDLDRESLSKSTVENDTGSCTLASMCSCTGDWAGNHMITGMHNSLPLSYTWIHICTCMYTYTCRYIETVKAIVWLCILFQHPLPLILK